MIQDLQGGELDPHYAGFFECFNQQLFYEAHDVLEELWLPRRREPDGLFYKGLIQLAGAFVHLQKDRLSPAAALFRLARQTDGGRRALPDRAGDASLATRFPNVARIRQG